MYVNRKSPWSGPVLQLGRKGRNVALAIGILDGEAECRPTYISLAELPRRD